MAVLPTLEQILNDSKPRALLTGHSLGGAAAQLTLLEIRERFPDSDIFAITFGAPTIFTELNEDLTQVLKCSSINFINKTDIVPWMPRSILQARPLPLLQSICSYFCPSQKPPSEVHEIRSAYKHYCSLTRITE
jgi:hypothetical protein